MRRSGTGFLPLFLGRRGATNAVENPVPLPGAMPELIHFSETYDAPSRP